MCITRTPNFIAPGLGGGGIKDLADPLGLFTKPKPIKLEPAPDPEAERLAAEAAATASANAKIVDRQRRRRSQGNLLATLGGPQDALGAKVDPDGYTPLVGQPAPMGYVTAGRAGGGGTLPGGGGYGGGGGGGGGGRPRTQLV